MNKNKLLVFGLLLGMSHTLSALAEASTKYSVNVGAILFSDFSSISSEDYVGASTSVPISLSIKNSHSRISISTAYLSQEQDDGSTDVGFGDLSVALSYPVNESFSVAAKHKFATGDETLGFSSGEPDNTLSIDYFTMSGYRRAYFSTLSHKWVGVGDDLDRQNTTSVSVGTSYTFPSKFTLASSIDYNQSSYTTSDDTVSVTLFGSHRINKTWAANWLIGTDSTQTHLIGTTLSYSF